MAQPKVMEMMEVADTYASVDFNLNIVLECSDGMACVFSKLLAQKCELFANLIKTETGEVKIPLSEIRSDTMRKIHMYLDMHYAEWPPELKVKKPLRKDLKDSLSEADYNFYANELLENGDIKKSDSVFLVLKAAQYLECTPILEFACAALANIVRGIKNDEEFYELFNVTEPFTEAEKDKLYDEYEYRKTENTR